MKELDNRISCNYFKTKKYRSSGCNNHFHCYDLWLISGWVPLYINNASESRKLHYLSQPVSKAKSHSSDVNKCTWSKTSAEILKTWKWINFKLCVTSYIIIIYAFNTRFLYSFRRHSLELQQSNKIWEFCRDKGSSIHSELNLPSVNSAIKFHLARCMGAFFGGRFILNTI